MRRLAWRLWAGAPFRSAGIVPRCGRRRRPEARRLAVEPLEARLVPTFLAPRIYDAGSNPVASAVGDFNGDGIPDLAVTNQGSTYLGLSDSTLSVLLGNGNGTFQPARNFAAGAGAYSVVVADFNGDGILDLAIAEYFGTRVLLGNGDGSFQVPSFGYVTGRSTAVAVGDFNGDGPPDLAVANLFGGVFILPNDGASTSPTPRGGAATARHVRASGWAEAFAPTQAARAPVTPPATDPPRRPVPPPSGTWCSPPPARGVAAAPLAVAYSREARDAIFIDSAFDPLEVVFAGIRDILQF